MILKEARKVGRQMIIDDKRTMCFMNYAIQDGYYPTIERTNKSTFILLKNGTFKPFNKKR